ncbi:hypothetical protein [Natranaeroarchaeum sulfidigenes]|uniref:DUF8135 domain-containing protein n=1 Tax=Natranaeroarchaeum sulfidigenes TaxID=2784880 RepID=A0A897MLM3_9EURY|nr:hypothetical protein [Natranaeroarchaeum sulfidigenes]QSG01514.1 Uncharacterized protein AArcS_0279 [Natranaeroarchaeum sulfidigenes]
MAEDGSSEDLHDELQDFSDDLPDELHDPPTLRPDDESAPALESHADAGTDESPSGRQGPLEDLADKLGRRREERTEGEYDDLFVSEDVGDLDSDLVWEELETGGVTVEPKLGTEEYVVPTSSYCETCEYFSAPPEVACGHEGTEITDMVDIEHFTVRNCPKVAEDIALGEFDAGGE